MDNAVIENRPDSDDISLYYRGRLWKRSKHTLNKHGGHEWVEVKETHGVSYRDPNRGRAPGDSRAVLQKTQERHCSKAASIPTSPIARKD